MSCHPTCQNIEHVVVLMMENRSFDHLLGDFKGIDASCDGVDPNKSRELGPNDLDLWLPNRLPFDPGHEFENVKRQLGGNLAQPSMTGFEQDVLCSFAGRDEYSAHLQKMTKSVMSYVPFGKSPAQDLLPGIQGLARNFVVCDRWFSSMPGPTWPNRFFALMGSAHGRVKMPDNWTDIPEALETFCAQICKHSIFSLMDQAGLEARVYSDCALPLSLMAKGCGKPGSINEFEEDVSADRLPAFSWIEPDYSYQGSDGNSQHPPEHLAYGDAFISRIFNRIATCKQVWEKTLFVLLYDEHGGFYDHVPPPACVAPDSIPADVNFDFTRLGVRVPAILASPWLEQRVDKTDFYDHTSLLAFVCDRFGLDRARLGKRVQAARHFGESSSKNWCDQKRDLSDKLPLRVAVQPGRSRDFTRGYETGLATESRRLIEGLHAYMGGVAPATLSAWSPGASEPGQSRRSLGGLVDLADSVRYRLQPGKPFLGTDLNASAPLRLLCLHGVGHGDAADLPDAVAPLWSSDPQWRKKWAQTIRCQLIERGLPEDHPVEFEWLRYDDLFGDGPDLLQILHGLASLLVADKGEELTDRALIPPIGDVLRWTVGMVVQWLADRDDLRQKLSDRVIEGLRRFRPHLILGHSLGSMIAYDALRRVLVASERSGDTADLELLEQAAFVSFGSQIAHPVVVREGWGGSLQPLQRSDGRGIAAWFHLYNPHDRVYTRPISTKDQHRVDVLTDFEIPLQNDLFDLDHDGQCYLGHERTSPTLWSYLMARYRGRPAVLRHWGSLPEDRGITTQHSAVRPVRPSRRRALLIGIDHYPDSSMRLEGCLNDVYLMSQILQEGGFDGSEIRLLLDQRATAAAMAERLEWLVDGARPGDERVLFYAGHGAQIPSSSPTALEPDRLNETLVPVDFDWDDPSTHFTDKQFHRYYSHLPFKTAVGDDAIHGGAEPGVHLVAIFDCCHAAGMTRGSGGRARGISPPADIRHRNLNWDARSAVWEERGPYPAALLHPRVGTPDASRQWGQARDLRCFDKGRYHSLRETLGHGGPFQPLLIHGAGESQLAHEVVQGAQSHGAFTWALAEEIRRQRRTARSRKERSAEELIQAVAKAFRSRGMDQTPTVVGPEALRRAPLSWVSGSIR